jgi:hypothetical protein
MEFKTRFDINLIVGEMTDRLIIDNNDNWNGDKTRVSERYELVKLRFRNYSERDENVNIQIKCGISICERKMEDKEIFKKSENFFV